MSDAEHIPLRCTNTAMLHYTTIEHPRDGESSISPPKLPHYTNLHHVAPHPRLCAFKQPLRQRPHLHVQSTPLASATHAKHVAHTAWGHPQGFTVIGAVGMVSCRKLSAASFSRASNSRWRSSRSIPLASSELPKASCIWFYRGVAAVDVQRFGISVLTVVGQGSRSHEWRWRWMKRMGAAHIRCLIGSDQS